METTICPLVILAGSFAFVVMKTIMHILKYNIHGMYTGIHGMYTGIHGMQVYDE